MSGRFPYTDPYEGNPFPASVPESIRVRSPETYQFLDQIVILLREQHFVTQTGGTTLPWQLLTKLSVTQLFNLGSRGRFLHPTHGVIVARYVRYRSPKPGLWSGAPVGYYNSKKVFTWEATNRFAQATAPNLVGLCASYLAPADGDYGWVIDDGVNIQSVTYNGASPPYVGQALCWSGDSQVGARLSGSNLLGVIMSLAGLIGLTGTNKELAPGTIRISVQSQ